MDEIPAYLFNEWMEFDRIEPIGVEAQFLGHAITATTLANINRDGKKQKQPYSIDDFMPEFIKPPKPKQKPKTAEDIANDVVSFFKGIAPNKE